MVDDTLSRNKRLHKIIKAFNACNNWKFSQRNQNCFCKFSLFCKSFLRLTFDIQFYCLGHWFPIWPIPTPWRFWKDPAGDKQKRVQPEEKSMQTESGSNTSTHPHHNRHKNTHCTSSVSCLHFTVCPIDITTMMGNTNISITIPAKGNEALVLHVRGVNLK